MYLKNIVFMGCASANLLKMISKDFGKPKSKNYFLLVDRKPLSIKLIVLTSSCVSYDRNTVTVVNCSNCFIAWLDASIEIYITQ